MTANGCRACGKGEYRTFGGDDSECHECPAGKYSEEAGAVACKWCWSEPPAGRASPPICMRSAWSQQRGDEVTCHRESGAFFSGEAAVADSLEHYPNLERKCAEREQDDPCDLDDYCWQGHAGCTHSRRLDFSSTGTTNCTEDAASTWLLCSDSTPRVYMRSSTPH